MKHALCMPNTILVYTFKNSAPSSAVSVITRLHKTTDNFHTVRLQIRLQISNCIRAVAATFEVLIRYLNQYTPIACQTWATIIRNLQYQM